MFTNEFILLSCEYARNKELASTTLRCLKELNIKNNSVIKNCEAIIKSADSFHQQSLQQLFYHFVH